MDTAIITYLTFILVIYGVILFFDLFFKSCAHYPYLKFLEGTGFEVKFFRIHWTTTVFNRWILRIGTSNTRLWNLWFKFGLYAVLLFLPIATLLLLITIASSFFSSSSSSSSFSSTSGNGGKFVEPILPGVDFPLSDFGYYGASLLISSLFHEAGHALAAVKEDVHLNSIGIAVFFILPVAYVNLSKDRFTHLNPWNALRIVCAGIWHNLILSLFAYLLLLSTPLVFSLFYDVGKGVTVSYLTKNCPIKSTSSNKGLNLRDVITKINDCEIVGEDSWFECLHILEKKKFELCVHADLIHTLDESVPLKLLPNGVYDCCGLNKPSHLCFEYMDRNNGILEIPPHVCLPGRSVIEKSTHSCSYELKCPSQMHCIKPMFDNYTNLFKIHRKDDSNIIYIGHASDFTRTVKISSYVPNLIFTTTTFPDILTKFLIYLVVFSLGLGAANVLPCLFLDGEKIIQYIIQIFFTKRNLSQQTAKNLSLTICLIGTVVLILYTIYSYWTKLYYFI